MANENIDFITEAEKKLKHEIKTTQFFKSIPKEVFIMVASYLEKSTLLTRIVSLSEETRSKILDNATNPELNPIPRKISIRTSNLKSKCA